MLLEDADGGAVHLEVVTNNNLNVQAVIHNARELARRLEVVVAQLWDHVLHEDCIGNWVQALWKHLFFSEVNDTASFNILCIAPVNVAILRELWLRSLFSLIERHVNDERNGFPIATQLGQLLHFELSTQEFIEIDRWQVLLQVDHLFMKFTNGAFILLDVFLQFRVVVLVSLRSFEIVLGSPILPGQCPDILLEFVDLLSDFGRISLTNKLVYFSFIFVHHL